MVRKSQVPRIVMTRMPEGLHARLRKEARLNSHSVNAEIVLRLWQTFSKEEKVKDHSQLAKQVSTATVEGFIGHLKSDPEVVKRLLEQIPVEPKTKGEEK
jgi:hypothetical protein